MVLFIDACARDNSRTRQLAEAVLSHLDENDPEVERVDLYELNLRPLTQDIISKRNEAALNGDFSDKEYDLAKQFIKADTIVIAAPYWDFSFPAILKLYIERISVNGVTFSYDEQGVPHGMSNAKKLYYVTTSGGEIGDFNFGYDYIKGITMALFGVKDCVCIRAVGLDLYDVDAEKVLDNARQSLGSLIK